MYDIIYVYTFFKYAWYYINRWWYKINLYLKKKSEINGEKNEKITANK